MMNQQHNDIRKRLEQVKANISKGAQAAGRDGDDINLIAVSKTFSAEQVRPVIEAGHRIFGENRVQEAADKWPILKQEFPDIELHLIGPLQSNKARVAIDLFDVIQTLDRLKLARVLADNFQNCDTPPSLMVQVNTGEEPQKAGIMPLEADDFIKACREEYELKISGLMCIPPIDEEPSLHFALLEKIAKRNGVSNLSIGMSADYERAIPFGATYLRVGSAIFGARRAVKPV